jgi:hypothetical protein
MKKILVMIGIAGCINLHSQLPYTWQNISNTQGTASSENSNGITIDNATNTTYIVGTFSGTLTLPGASSITSTGGKDIFVAEMSTSGSCTQLIRLGTTSNDEGFGITYANVSPNRYIYICGVENGEGVLYRLDANNLGATNIRRVLAPNSSHPNFSYYTGYCIPRAIGFYGNQVIVGGSYSNIVSCQTSTGYIHLTSSAINNGLYPDSKEAFIGRFANDLFCTAATGPNTAGPDNEIMALTCRNQRVYITGYFKNANGIYNNLPLRFASSGSTMTAQGTRDVFVVSAYIPTATTSTLTFNADQIQGGSTVTETIHGSQLWQECGYGITSNATAIYVTGYIGGTFGTATLTGVGSFVARFNYNGSNISNTAPAWIYVAQPCTTGTGPYSRGSAITCDATNIYCVGEAQWHSKLIGLTGAYCVGNATENPGYIAKYDLSGNLLIAERIDNDGSTTNGSGSTVPLSIVVNDCYLAYTGNFYDDDFNPGLAGNLSSTHGTYNKRLMTLAINPIQTPVLTPVITGNTTFCGSAALTFTGSTSQGTAINTFWEIVESNSSGVPVGGGYSFSTWTGAAPGVYTFPSSVPCGKYYRVKLAVSNACIGWAETAMVIYINCLPNVSVSDATICNGGCTTLTVSTPEANTVYSWAPGSIPNGTTANVCPTSTTTYTVTATNTLTGCTKTDLATVTVVNNDPNFSPSANTGNSSYLTISAVPNDLSASSISGFGYAWIVEGLDPNNNVLFTINNPSCWWTFPGASANVFNGFDHVATAYSGTYTSLPNCTIPTQGKFLYNYKYRITRGTWNDYCGWQQSSWTTTYSRSSDDNSSVSFIEDEDAPDFSYLMDQPTPIQVLHEDDILVYPNPSNGRFIINVDNQMIKTIVVNDAMGKMVTTIDYINLSKAIINLDKNAKGIYFLEIHLENGDKTVLKKIILE